MPRLPLLKHPILHCKNKWYHHKCKYGTTPEGTIIEVINGVRFPFDFTLGKMIKSMYFGCYEFEILRLMKKYLKPRGVFLDIGANVGYISAIGAGLVGKSGEVHGFEPVPTYFNYLRETAELNSAYRIVANNFALGEKASQVSIASHRRNIGGNSIVPGFVPEEDVAEITNIQVKTLDEYIQIQGLSRISLIKIDTEGFELPVLLGFSHFLDEHKTNRPPVIAEISPQAFELMDRELCELDEFMSNYGYESYAVCGRHGVNITNLSSQATVLFKH